MAILAVEAEHIFIAQLLLLSIGVSAILSVLETPSIDLALTHHR